MHRCSNWRRRCLRPIVWPGRTVSHHSQQWRSSVKDLVIFGTGAIAELADLYFREDADRRVAGFTVDAAYKTSDSLLGRPLVSFDEVEAAFSPDTHDLFV